MVEEGIFRYECRVDGFRAYSGMRAGWTVSGPPSCCGSLSARDAALTPRHYGWEGLQRENDIAGVYGESQSIPRFCERGARILHRPFDLPISSIFCSIVVQPAVVSRVVEYFKSFPHA